MFRSKIQPASACLLPVLVAFSIAGCAKANTGGSGIPPATAGVHTVMGRAFFPGGIMLLVDAHLRDGEAVGTVEYTQVQSRGDNTLRVFVDVECVGLYQDGTEAVVAGLITRQFGDLVTEINPGDWWVVHVQEGGVEGDLISTRITRRQQALDLCHEGSKSAATLRAVDGDLSIH